MLKRRVRQPVSIYCLLTRLPAINHGEESSLAFLNREVLQVDGIVPVTVSVLVSRTCLLTL